MKIIYGFVGKLKQLKNDLEWAIDMEEQKEIEEGWNTNCFCDTNGYCGNCSKCK